MILKGPINIQITINHTFAEILKKSSNRSFKPVQIISRTSDSNYYSGKTIIPRHRSLLIASEQSHSSPGSLPDWRGSDATL